MARDFMILMAGLIFAFVDVNLTRFNLLPDFVGYGLIAIATHQLAQYSPRFQTARNLALPLVGLSLLIYLVPLGLAHILLLLSAVGTIVLVAFLLGAVIRFTEERNRPDLAGHALTYRRIYIGIAMVALAVQWAAQTWPEGTEGFVGIMAVATIAILAFILRLLYVISQDLAVDATVS